MCPYCARAFACACDDKGGWMDSEYLINIGKANIHEAFIWGDLSIQYFDNDDCNYTGNFVLDLSLLRAEEDTPKEVLESGEYECIDFVKKIKYCPMCGQKLVIDEVD